MTKPRLYSGMQPSADSLQIGNYIGALLQWRDLQDAYEAFFSVVDLHALTQPNDPAELREKTRRTAAQYIAAGIEPSIQAALRLGGTLTGEHGVGILKRRWLADELGPDQWELQRAITRVFDPAGILNPGKVFAP